MGFNFLKRGKRQNDTQARRGELGNVFFTLFGAVALVGVVGVATSTLMRGPVGTVVKLNQSAKADAQMQIAQKLAMLEAAQKSDVTWSSGDCDSDGYVEPIGPLKTSAASCVGPVPGDGLGGDGGGCLPDEVGSSKNDPWGTNYGYCAWDHGAQTGSGCSAYTGDNAALLAGTNAQNETSVAIISAGPDRTFQTTCAADPAYVTKPSGSDDIVLDINYAGAITASGGLWSLKSGDPDVATIGNKDIEVGGTGFFSAGGRFSGGNVNLSNSALEFGANGLLFLPDEVSSSTCNAANQGVLRRNTAGGTQEVVEVCDFSGIADWAEVGGSGSSAGAAGNVGDIQFRSTGVGAFDADTGFNYATGTDTLSVANLGVGTNATVGGTLGVTGAATFSNTLRVDGDVSDGNGDVIVADGLTVNNGGTFLQTLRVDGNISDNDSAVTIADDLTTTGATVLQGTLDAQGVVSNSGAGAAGSVRIGDTFNVTGAVDFDSNLNIDGSISSTSANVMVSDNLDVSGVVYSSSFILSGGATDNEGLYYNGSEGLALKTQGNVALLIDSAGDVGVNITGSPTAQLDIGGEIRLRSSAGYVSGNACSASGMIAYNGTDELLICSSGTGLWETVGTSGGGGGGVGGVWTDEAGYIRYENSTFIIDEGQATLPFSSTGTKMFWMPAKQAFRAGSASGSEWDNANIGTHSMALGQNVQAKGNNSVAMGLSSTADGLSSFAAGDRAVASAEDSVALGSQVQALGTASVALGNQATAAAGALNSMVLGLGTAAGVAPQVTGASALGIFMGDQSGVTVATSNAMVLAGGKLIIDPDTTSAGAVAPSGSLTVDVQGKVGATSFCSETDTFCFTAADIQSGSVGVPGADSEIVFNSGGVFGSDPNFIFVSSTGSLGVNTNAISGTLNVDVGGDVGAVNYCDENGANCFAASDITGGSLGAPGNDREIVFNSGNSLGTDTNFVFTSAGQMGIGTMTPSDSLHVYMSANAQNIVNIENANPAGALGDAVLKLKTRSGEYNITSDDNTKALKIFDQTSAAYPGTLKIQLDDTGLGLGVAPLNGLDVGTNTIRLRNGADYQTIVAGTWGTHIVTNKIAGGVLRIGENQGAVGITSLDGGTAYDLVFSADTGKGVALVGGSGTAYTADDGLFVDSSNNVGINDITPDHMLDVAGNIGLNAASYINFGDTDGTTGYGIRDNAGIIECKNSAGAWTACVTGAGVLAINDLTDAYTIYDAGTTSNFIMGRAGAAALTAGAVGNLFIGEDAGATTANSTATTDYNLAIGYQALKSLTTGDSNTAVGWSALKSLTTGDSNTALGYNTLQVSTGGFNTAVGADALKLNTTGGYNVAVGGSAMHDTTTGAQNVAVGTNALWENKAKQESTAVGYDAMRYADSTAVASITYNTAVGAYALRGGATASANTGTQNTAVGHSSLLSNTTGTANTSVGTGALLSNNAGDSNTAVGTWTLEHSTGDGNTAIGRSALNDNVAKEESTAVGFAAMQYADSSAVTAVTYNTALGAYALRGSATAANNTGTNNTAIGHSSLMANTTGSWNAALGTYALLSNTTGSGNAAVGQGALSSVTTGGLNTAMGLQALYNQTGSGSVALGAYALNLSTSGTNTAIGYQAGNSITTGTGNLLLGYDVDTPTATTDNYMNIGNIFFGSGVGTTAGSKVGAVEYCDETLANCFTAGDVAGGTITAPGNDREIVFNSGNNLGTHTNLVFTSAGWLGIGTAAPVADLHVVGKATTDNFLGLFAENGITPESSAAGVANTGHMLSVQGSGAAYFMGRDVTNNIEFIFGTSSAGVAFAGSMTPHNLDLRTGNVARMTLQNSNGAVGIGDTTPDHMLDVAGNIGMNVGSYLNFGDTDGTTGYGIRDNAGTIECKNSAGSWAACGSGATAANVPLSGITAATGANTILNGVNNQVWNWALTGATADGFTFGENVASAGGAGGQSILKATNLATSTAVPLLVTNVSDSAVSFRVNDDGTDTDSSPFTINASGQVGIGTATPDANAEMHIINPTAGQMSNLVIGNPNVMGNDSSDGSIKLYGESSGAVYAGEIIMGSMNMFISAPSQIKLTDSMLYLGSSLFFEDAAATKTVEMVHNGTNFVVTNTSGDITFPSDNVSIGGDLTVTGDDLFMATNTAGYLLVADGTNYNPVAMSGDAALSSAGALAIGADKILESHLKSVNGATDEYCLTYEFTTGDFEWQTCAAAGVLAINDLTDAFTDYATDHNFTMGRAGAAALTVGAIRNTFVGEGAGSVSGVMTNAADENTALGFQALTALTTGGWNTALGVQTLQSNTTGGWNTAVGANALTANTTGNSNVALGNSAAGSNTVGYGNTGLGTNALSSNVAKQESTAVGFDAMQYADSTATGAVTYNTAVGAYALRGSATAANNTGTKNTAIGHSALMSNTSGSFNAAIGQNALDANTTGQDNIAIGSDPLSLNTTASYSIAIGGNTLAAKTTTGNGSVAIGYSALVASTTGSNTAIGYLAGNSITTGTGNILLGYDVDTPAAGTNNYLNIGNAITGTMDAAAPFDSSTITVAGDLTISGDDLFMATNTAGYMLVADGTNYNPVAMSGDATIAGTGAVTIAADKILESHLKSVNGATDEYCLTYETTTGDFEWQTCAAAGILAIDDLTDAYTNYGSSSNFIMGRAGAAALTAGAIQNTFIGELAGATAANSTANTDVNTAVGYAALANNTSGYSNVAVGALVLQNNTSGDRNTALGTFAAQQTTSSKNIAIGAEALNSNKAKSENTAVGFQSMLYADDTVTAAVSYNTALGAYALRGSATAANNTGTNNTAIGHSSLMANTTGSWNAALGTYALLSNTTGSGNAAVGQGALSSVTTGGLNTAMGLQALYNQTGSGSVALGAYALNLATSGTNTAIGYQAGNSITTGTGNLLLGYNVDTPTATTDNYMNIGNIFFGSGVGTTAGSMVGAVEYCDETLANCFTAGDVVGGGAPKLSAIVAADAANTILNGVNNQVWNWALTGATADGFTFGENVASTGGAGGQSILKATNLATSTAVPLLVTNVSDSAVSFRVNDDGTDTDSSPFTINATGQVGIGTASPDANAEMHIINPTAGQISNLVIGNPNVMGNDSSDGSIKLYGESSGAVYAGEIIMGSMNMFISAPSQIKLTDSMLYLGSSLFFEDAAATKTVEMVHNGTNFVVTNTSGDITFPSDNVSIGGDLTVTGDDLFMATNTAGYMLVADGTNYNPVAMSGDATIAGTGAVTIGADKITEGMLKAVNGGTDEFCLTYETTTGDFEWQTCAAAGSLAIDDLSDAYTIYDAGTTSNFIMGRAGAAALTAGAVQNLFIGESVGVSLNNASADNNVAVGFESLNALTSGSNNAAFGVRALRNTTTGDSNTANGYAALRDNTTGRYNTASGNGALYSNVAKQESTALGYQAMYYADDTTTASVTYNTAVGAHALKGSATAASNTGTNNTAVGHSALIGNTSGWGNTAVGSYAMYDNTTGFSNAAVGRRALVNNTTGDSNAALGYDALRLNTTGGNNTAVGSNALDENLTGFNNTAVGYSALTKATGGANTAVGADALRLTTSGQWNTALGQAALYNNTTGNGNTAVGITALTLSTTGVNTAFGFQAGNSITTGTGNLLIGYDVDTPTATTDNYLNIGNAITGTMDAAAPFDSSTITVAGDLTISGDDLFMATNTAGYLLVADGTNYNPVAMSGDATIAGTGAVTIGADKITEAKLKAVNAATDEYCLTYETTTGDFEWQTCAAAGALAINDLSDAFTDYTTDHNFTMGRAGAAALTVGAIRNTFVGEGAGSVSGVMTNAADENTALGFQALTALTTGGWNTALGVQTLQSNTTGGWNTAVGANALTANTTGNSNVALGNSAAGSNTVGYGNVGLGTNALSSNVAKQESTAVGFDAMQYADSTATGAVTYNTALGAYALRGSATASANTGISNTAVGHSALIANTTANNNTALGAFALSAATTGDTNTAVGERTLLSNTTGAQNVAVGNSAMRFHTTGGENVAIGENALYGVNGSSIASNQNVAIGSEAGNSITTGDANILIGYNVDTSAAGASNELNIGNALYGTGILGGTVKIGIGNAAPEATLEVTGGLCVSDAAGDNCAVTAGNIKADGTFVANAFDVAERYAADTAIEPGTIVELDPAKTLYVRESAIGSATVLGIVSTDPGLVLGWEDNDLFDTAPHVSMVALSGRVPLKVTGEGGAIAIGDRVALSGTVAGHGTKAGAGTGTIVGVALEGFTPADALAKGTIMVFVQTRDMIVENDLREKLSSLEAENARIDSALNDLAADVKGMKGQSGIGNAGFGPGVLAGMAVMFGFAALFFFLSQRRKGL